MPIQVRCPVCGALLQVSQSLIGKRGKCARCGRIIELKLQAIVGQEEKDEYRLAPLPEEDTGLPRPTLPSPELQCARCGGHLQAYVLVCPYCGADPLTGMLLEGEKTPKGELPEGSIGIFKLALMVLGHPIRTIGIFACHLNYVDTLRRIGLVYLASLPILVLYGMVYAGASGEHITVLGLSSRLTADILGIAVSAAVVDLLAGWAGGRNYLGALAAFAYLAGAVRYVLLLFVIAAALKIIDAAGLATLMVCFSLWTWVLQVIATRAVYEVPIIMAVAVNLVACLITLYLRIWLATI